MELQVLEPINNYCENLMNTNLVTYDNEGGVHVNADVEVLMQIKKNKIEKLENKLKEELKASPVKWNGHIDSLKTENATYSYKCETERQVKDFDGLSKEVEVLNKTLELLGYEDLKIDIKQFIRYTKVKESVSIRIK